MPLAGTRWPSLSQRRQTRHGGNLIFKAVGKILRERREAQRATAIVPEAVYEQDFLSYSYGFRPGSGTRR